MPSRTPTSIDNLSEDELRDLNLRIVERLRMLSQLRAHGAMMQFSIGDRVSFVANGRRHFGIITRYNKKTVSLLVDGGHPWTVSPSLLSSVEQPPPSSGPASPQPEVLPLLRLTGNHRQPRR